MVTGAREIASAAGCRCTDDSFPDETARRRMLSRPAAAGERARRSPSSRACPASRSVTGSGTNAGSRSRTCFVRDPTNKGCVASGRRSIVVPADVRHVQKALIAVGTRSKRTDVAGRASRDPPWIAFFAAVACQDLHVRHRRRAPGACARAPPELVERFAQCPIRCRRCIAWSKAIRRPAGSAWVRSRQSSAGPCAQPSVRQVQLLAKMLANALTLPSP